MIEPEMAFCDLDGDMDARRGVPQVRHPRRARALPPTTWSSSTSASTTTVLATLEHVVDSDFEHVTYTEAVAILEKSGKAHWEFPVALGRRPAERARALPHRGDVQEAGDRHRLPEGDQGVLHARERRRQDGARDGRAGARASARSSAAASARSGYDVLREQDPRAGPAGRGLLVVPRPAPFGSAPHAGFGLGLRAPDACI